MTSRRIQIPRELSVENLSRVLSQNNGEMASLGQDGPGNPDDVVGVVLFFSVLEQILQSQGDGDGGIIPRVAGRSARLEELEGTASAVGIAATENITLEVPAGVSVVQIFEVVGDSDGSSFDVAIYEDQDRTRLNQVYLNTGNNLHFVDRILEGQDYRDRNGGEGQDDHIYLTVTNNDAAVQDITVRVKFTTETDVF